MVWRSSILLAVLFGVAKVRTLANGLGQTPARGWNAWNSIRCEGLNEVLIREVADAMVSSGLRDAGYTYVNIDDCWQVARNPATGAIVPDPVRFPSGLKMLADWLHSHDMLFGIYTAAHGRTCQSRPGSYLYEEIDSNSYCQFGIDYLKIDTLY